MPLYHFFVLDKFGHIDGLREAVECVDDDDAIAKARSREGNRVIEVWVASRRVALIDAAARNLIDAAARTTAGEGAKALAEPRIGTFTPADHREKHRNA